jgi:chromatin remodeling complex protein RSC6
MKPVQPDSALAAVIGSDAQPRTQITKKLWVYIKANGLQDATNRRNINADEKLRAVFNGKRTVNMMELAKFIKAHTS